MKKIFFSLLAIAALASCTKTEATYEPASDEIKINPVTALATKANVFGAIDDVYYPKAENFDVYAYWANEAAGAEFTDATTYLGGDAAVEFINKGAFWGGATTYYWPKNGSLRFAAYSPSSLDMAHVLATDTYTLTGFTQAGTTDKTIDVLVAPTSKSYTAQTAAENVSVVFEHACAWITIKVKSTEEAAGAFTLGDVVINTVKNQGNLTAVMAGENKAMTWKLANATADYTISVDETTVGTAAAVIDDVANGTVVLPQEPTTITVNYTQNALEGTPALENQKVTVDLALDAKVSEQNFWEAGKHYTYTLIFDLDEILINPSVEDWTDVDAGEITVDDKAQTVSNAEELKAALAIGGNIVLKNDIEVAEELQVAKTVVLDLNGYTLSTSTSARGITNTSELTIKNGTITGNNSTIAVLNYAPVEPYEAALVLENVNVTNDGNHAVGAYSLDYTTIPYEVHKLSPTSLTINGGTIECNNTGETYAVKTWGFCDVAIADATVNGTYGGISIDSSDLAMTNTNVTGGTHSLHVYCGEVKYDDACQVGDNVYYQVVGETAEKVAYDLYVNGVCYSAAAAKLAAAVAAGGDVTLDSDVVLSETLVIEKNVTLNLNGKKIVNQVENASTDVIVVKAGATLTIEGEGNVEAVSGNDGYAVIADGTVNIQGGSYKSGFDANNEANACVYARGEGKVYVSGGDFTSEGVYTLNKKDADRETTVIEVTGGTFYGWNPANNAAEGANTNFVAKGYKVVAEGQVYTVVAE